MQTHNAKRVEIIIEAVMERRLTEVLLEAGVTGFTVLPVSGGSGRSSVSVWVQPRSVLVTNPKRMSWRIPGLPRRCGKSPEQQRFQPREIPSLNPIHRG